MRPRGEEAQQRLGSSALKIDEIKASNLNQNQNGVSKTPHSRRARHAFKSKATEWKKKESIRNKLSKRNYSIPSQLATICVAMPLDSLLCLWIFFALLIAATIGLGVPGLAWKSFSGGCDTGDAVTEGDCWKGATLLSCAAFSLLMAVIILIVICIIYSRRKKTLISKPLAPQLPPPATRDAQTMVEVMGANGKPMMLPMAMLSSMYPEGQVFAVVPHEHQSPKPKPEAQQQMDHHRLYEVDPYGNQLDAPINRMQRRITASKQVLEDGIGSPGVNRGGGASYFDWTGVPSVVPLKPYLPPIQRPLNYQNFSFYPSNKVAPLPSYEPFTPKPILPAPGAGAGRVVATAPHAKHGDRNVDV